MHYREVSTQNLASPTIPMAVGVCVTWPFGVTMVAPVVLCGSPLVAPQAEENPKKFQGK